MQFVASTPLALLLAFVLLMRGPHRGLPVLLAVTPLGAMAAFNLPAVGGASITATDLCVTVAAMLVLLRHGGPAEVAGSLRPGQPGFALALLFAWACFATVFFPRIFAGATEVYGIGRVANATGIVMRPLGPDGGNVTQLFRMTLSVLAFFVFATLFRRQPGPEPVLRGMIAATVVHAAMGLADLVTHAAGRRDLMDVFRTANYAMAVNQEMAGLKRMVGGFPEASAFGYYTLGLFGFWLQYWLSAGRSRVAGWMLLLTTAVLLRSTSSSAYVAATGFLLIFTALRIGSGVAQSVSRRSAAILGGAVVLLPLVVFTAVMAYETNAEVRAFVDRSLLNKLESDSGVERMSWNLQALRNFVETGLIGAGLGSVRASNWLVASLATLGLVGTALYLAFIVSVLRPRGPLPAGPAGDVVLALRAACLALLLRALVVKATPNLEIIFFLLAGIAVGMTRGAALALPQRQGDVRPHLPGPAPRLPLGDPVR